MSFLEPSIINQNFISIDKHYENQLNFNDLDERCFIQTNKTFTPSKFTPFSRQGYANKGRRSTQNEATNYSSHRILTY